MRQVQRVPRVLDDRAKQRVRLDGLRAEREPRRGQPRAVRSCHEEPRQDEVRVVVGCHFRDRPTDLRQLLRAGVPGAAGEGDKAVGDLHEAGQRERAARPSHSASALLMPDVEALLVEPDLNARISKVWLVLDVRGGDRLPARVARTATAVTDPHLRRRVAGQRSGGKLLANDGGDIASAEHGHGGVRTLSCQTPKARLRHGNIRRRFALRR